MQKRLWNTAEVKFFKLNYEKVMKKLKEYSEKALAKGVKAVILIGSLAKGDYTAFSDADILIIFDETPKNPIDRIKEFIDPSLPIEVEPRVYTTSEVLKMAKEKRRIIKEAIRYGKLLAGDREIINTIKNALKNKEFKSTLR
ncbi:nucleotidyltransferase domain-containing protein [Candidatus Bathyarchaeota archaeon]|nr:nucleotidyltransferase domain-containing protein [Candidatus Bathyarchaeota archaeon]